MFDEPYGVVHLIEHISDESNIFFSSNHLGTVSFNKLWPEQGFDALMNIVNNKPELVEHITIYDDQKKVVPIEDFISIINKLHIAKR